MKLKNKKKLLDLVMKSSENVLGLSYYFINNNGEWHPCQTNVLTEYQFSFRLRELDGNTKFEVKKNINQMEAKFLKVVQ